MSGKKFSTFQDIQKFQEKELVSLLKYLHHHSPFYKDLFRENNIDISKITSPLHLSNIPVTTKENLQQRNWDFLCVDKSEIVEYSSTSGTLGQPVNIALTESDLQRLALNEYLSFKCIDANAKDIFHLMLSLDRQFMAGIAYFLGARKLGAGIIRGGPGNLAMQIDTILRLCPTILIAVPSFVTSLITYASENSIDLNKTSVRKIICIGENIRNTDLTLNALGKRIAERWNVALYSTYASTEQQAAFTECSHSVGGHHQPEMLIFEILDDNDMPVKSGSYGELTITTLGVEGMPLLRYKTGDICTSYNEPCRCGRITQRISPIIGRKKHLIKFKGTTLYPQTIFNALNTIDGIADYVVRAFSNDLGTDEIEVIVSITANSHLSDAYIRQTLQSKLRILPAIKYLPLPDIQRMQVLDGKRKVSRFVDERNTQNPINPLRL